MDPISLSALEYDGLKELVGRRLKSALGRRALSDLAPTSDPAEVAVRRSRAAEALAYLHEVRAPSPGDVEDPAEMLAHLEPEGAILDPVEIARLTTVLRAGISFRDEIAAVRSRYPRVWDVAAAIPPLKPLLADVAGKVTPEGKVEDRASPELEKIRGRLAVLEGRLQRSMRSILERQNVRDVIQDAFVTVRSGRFVIPVRVESRRELPGIIHGASSTGATVFVEPMEVVEDNNELVTLRDEEEAEVRRVLHALSSRLRGSLPDLRALARALGEADLMGACALFARDFHAEPAHTGDGISLHQARHPVLEAALSARGGKVVPLNVEIPPGGRVLIISGPNTGGKTAALKTIGLLAMMNQSGILIPAAAATLPAFTQVLADVGDRQSITEDLSTFSARMLRVAEMSRTLASPALVLLDEVGAGTDPEEGGALAVAIVEHFRKRGACVVATTHHAALKIYAEVSEGATNASMEFDEAATAPTYRLIPDVAGRSGGIEIAARVGVPAEILQGARERLSDAHRRTDAYLAKLHALVESRSAEEARAREERQAASRERLEATERATEAEVELRAGYRKAVEQALARIASAGEEIVGEMRDRAAALQIRSELRKATRSRTEALREEARPPAPVHAKAEAAPAKSAGAGGIARGSIVRVEGLGATGTVEAVDARRGRADVMIKGKKMTVALSDCEPVSGPAAGAAPRVPPVLPRGVALSSSSKEGVSTELNLIGSTVDEAIGRLDKFLDDAALAGHAEVRVVHGHGTGRLRAAVTEFLSRHPLVESHHPADARSGGAGATVAVLRG